MPRWLVALLAAAVTAVVVVAGVAVVRTALSVSRVGERSDELACRTDSSLSGLQGFCVERVSRPELVVVPGRREIHVVPVVDGGSSGRMLSFGDPFTEDDSGDLAVVWTEDGGVRVTDPAGLQLVVPAARLDSLAD